MKAARGSSNSKHENFDEEEERKLQKVQKGGRKRLNELANARALRDKANN